MGLPESVQEEGVPLQPVQNVSFSPRAAKLTLSFTGFRGPKGFECWIVPEKPVHVKSWYVPRESTIYCRVAAHTLPKHRGSGVSWQLAALGVGILVALANIAKLWSWAVFTSLSIRYQRFLRSHFHFSGRAGCRGREREEVRLL